MPGRSGLGDRAPFPIDLTIKKTVAIVFCTSGRIDRVVKTEQNLYILEFKVMAQGTAQDAVVQIKEKGYVMTFATDDRPILLVSGRMFRREDTKHRRVEGRDC